MAETKIQQACLHVSTLHLGAHAYDAVKGFFQRRDQWPPVKLFVAEDNEAVIKALAKGRSPRLRHVARTHRVNLDWCYDLFRRPEVVARYVSTQYQIADLGTKAITKGETWQRLVALMGIKDPGRQAQRDKKEITKNKEGKSHSTACDPPINKADLDGAVQKLMAAYTTNLQTIRPTTPTYATHVAPVAHDYCGNHSLVDATTSTVVRQQQRLATTTAGQQQALQVRESRGRRRRLLRRRAREEERRPDTIPGTALRTTPAPSTLPPTTLQRTHSTLQCSGCGAIGVRRDDCLWCDD